MLTSDNPVIGSGLGGQTVTFTLGSGTTAQTCTGLTNASGAASCSFTVTNQPQGPIQVTDSFTGNPSEYENASASSTVNLPEGTKLTVTQGTGTYNTSGTVSATLTNTYTNQPVPNESVTITVNNTQPCTVTDECQRRGHRARSHRTSRLGPTHLTASFGGDTTTTPVLLSSNGLEHLHGEQGTDPR